MSDEHTLIDHFKVIEGIEQLAIDRPGIYTRRDDPSSSACVNTEFVDGKQVGSCIVGSFMVDILGIPAENMPSGSWETTINKVERKGEFKFTRKAKYLLGYAQIIQDGRKVSWSQIAGTLYSVAVFLERHAEDVRGDFI